MYPELWLIAVTEDRLCVRGATCRESDGGVAVPQYENSCAAKPYLPGIAVTVKPSACTSLQSSLNSVIYEGMGWLVRLLAVFVTALALTSSLGVRDSVGAGADRADALAQDSERGLDCFECGTIPVSEATDLHAVWDLEDNEDPVSGPPGTLFRASPRSQLLRFESRGSNRRWVVTSSRSSRGPPNA